MASRIVISWETRLNHSLENEIRETTLEPTPAKQLEAESIDFVSVSPESVAKVVKINQEKKPRLRGHWISSMVESAENNNFRERERDLPVTIASRQGEGIINRQGQEESARSKQRMRAKSNKAVSAMSKFKYNITTIAFQHQANQAGYPLAFPDTNQLANSIQHCHRTRSLQISKSTISENYSDNIYVETENSPLNVIMERNPHSCPKQYVSKTREPTEEDLETLFRSYKIQSIEIPKNPQTGSPCMYAFVDLATSFEATRAIAELSNARFGCCRVELPFTREPSPAVMIVTIGNDSIGKDEEPTPKRRDESKGIENEKIALGRIEADHVNQIHPFHDSGYQMDIVCSQETATIVRALQAARRSIAKKDVTKEQDIVTEVMTPKSIAHVDTYDHPRAISIIREVHTAGKKRVDIKMSTAHSIPQGFMANKSLNFRGGEADNRVFNASQMNEGHLTPVYDVTKDSGITRGIAPVLRALTTMDRLRYDFTMQQCLGIIKGMRETASAEPFAEDLEMEYVMKLRGPPTDLRDTQAVEDIPKEKIQAIYAINYSDPSMHDFIPVDLTSGISISSNANSEGGGQLLDTVSFTKSRKYNDSIRGALGDTHINPNAMSKESSTRLAPKKANKRNYIPFADRGAKIKILDLAGSASLWKQNAVRRIPQVVRGTSNLDKHNLKANISFTHAPDIGVPTQEYNNQFIPINAAKVNILDVKATSKTIIAGAAIPPNQLSTVNSQSNNGFMLTDNFHWKQPTSIDKNKLLIAGQLNLPNAKCNNIASSYAIGNNHQFDPHSTSTKLENNQRKLLSPSPMDDYTPIYAIQSEETLGFTIRGSENSAAIIHEPLTMLQTVSDSSKPPSYSKCSKLLDEMRNFRKNQTAWADRNLRYDELEISSKQNDDFIDFSTSSPISFPHPTEFHGEKLPKYISHERVPCTADERVQNKQAKKVRKAMEKAQHVLHIKSSQKKQHGHRVKKYMHGYANVHERVKAQQNQYQIWAEREEFSNGHEDKTRVE